MQLDQFFIFSFFISFIISSSYLFFGIPSGRVNIGLHLYTLSTSLFSGIRCKWPNQLNLWAFMWFIIFLCLINSPNSSFVLILHVPSLCFVGPKSFLTLSDPTSNLVRQYDFPVPLRCRKTSDTVFVAFVRPLSEPVRRFSSCSTDFSQQIRETERVQPALCFSLLKL
jgi:hypothetical protein